MIYPHIVTPFPLTAEDHFCGFERTVRVIPEISY
jgi:hypothetical protein